MRRAFTQINGNLHCLSGIHIFPPSEIQPAQQNREHRSVPVRPLIYPASENLRKHRTAPNGSKSKNKTADRVERGQKECAAAKCGKCLPLIR